MLTLDELNGYQSPGRFNVDDTRVVEQIMPPCLPPRRQPNRPLFQLFCLGKEWRVKDTGTG